PRGMGGTPSNSSSQVAIPSGPSGSTTTRLLLPQSIRMPACSCGCPGPHQAYLLLAIGATLNVNRIHVDACGCVGQGSLVNCHSDSSSVVVMSHRDPR